jgi:MFS superfamily sulfate permease-like transporter
MATYYLLQGIFQLLKFVRRTFVSCTDVIGKLITTPNTKKFMFKDIKSDLPASIVVLFVAIPLCLGIALASGAPLLSGLIAGIIGGIVVGSISGSSIGVSGPAAGLAVLVLNAIESLGGYEIFLLAVVIAGVIQIFMGYMKAGVIGYYFPSSVIKGMLTGIGIVIILKQIPHAFGYDADYEGDFGFFQPDGQNTFTELINMLDYISLNALIVATAGFFIIIIWDNILSKKHAFFKILQGPIVAVLFGVLYQVITLRYFPSWAVADEHTVNVPLFNSFSDFLAMFTLPDFSQIANVDVYTVAITIAVVASLETLLSVEATDKLDPAKRITPANRELIAQGIGNMASGLIGGLPVSQVIVRSSANVQSGGKSKLSAILHGIFLLILLVSIPRILNLIPLAVLASILIIVGYKLAKPALFKHMYSLGRAHFVPFMATILGLVFTDLLIGIGIGLVIGILNILLKNFRNSHFLHLTESDDENLTHKVNIVLSEEVTFLNKAAIMNELNKIAPNSEVEIDMTNSYHIDYDVLEIIDNFKISSETKGIKVNLIGRGKRETLDY